MATRVDAMTVDANGTPRVGYLDLDAVFTGTNVKLNTLSAGADGKDRVEYLSVTDAVGRSRLRVAALIDATYGGQAEFRGAQRFDSALSSGGQDIATTSTFVIAANQTRGFLILTNASDTDMWIALGGAAAVVGTGLLLAANGGRLEIETTSAVWAIQNGSGTKRIGVVEL